MEHLRSYVELGETFNVDYDMDEHEQQEIHPEYNPAPTSKVAASGDILSINDTVNWETLQKSKNADAMDVLYDPNKSYNEVEKYLDRIDEIGKEYEHALDGISEETQTITEEAKSMQNDASELNTETKQNVEEIKHRFVDLDEEINNINVETIQYTPKKRR
jgi:DNA repair ATPase RecN